MFIYFVMHVASLNNITVAGLDLVTNKYNLPIDWLNAQGLKECNNSLKIKSIKFRILFDPEIIKKSDRLQEIFRNKSEVCIYDTVPSFIFNAPDQATIWLDLVASLHSPFKLSPVKNIEYPSLYADAYNDVELALKCLDYYKALYNRYKLTQRIKSLEQEISICKQQLGSISIPLLLPDSYLLEAEDNYGDYGNYLDYYSD